MKKPAPKQEKKQNKVVIRNTGTAMGKALAAAMGGISLDSAEEKNISGGKERRQPALWRKKSG